MLSLNILFIIILGGGWLFSRLFAKIQLPAVLGMVVFGITCSIYLKPITSPLLWELAPFLKSFALIVILLRAGLGISKKTLKKVGLTAFLMAFLPCLLEGLGLLFLFKVFFGFSWPVAGLTGFMLAAVSPAVVVPSMLNLKAKGHQEVPTIVLAGASVDDVLAITIFSLFLGLARAQSVSVVSSLFSLPVSVFVGLGAGLFMGLLLARFFKKNHHTIRATEKALLVLVFAALLVQVGDTFHFAALLGIMTAGFVLLEKNEKVAHELANKFSKIWIFAEIVLFVLIGYSLDISVAINAGLKGLLVLALGLVIRSLAVLLATAFSGLNFKERLFCVIAYLPKATVQAALGGVALSVGLPEGQTILALAVLAIIFTAPLGLLGINFFGARLLKG